MKNFIKNKGNFSKEDVKYMELAIKLAEKGRGKTNPNPMVGAIIVKDGKIISTGYHRRAGSAHAEIEAINNCREPILGSTMYVTLEPCTIYGKTPPCVDEIIKHKFKEVIIGCTDPNPMVNGRGIDHLKKSGIKVRKGLLKDKISIQNEVFFKHIKTKMPFVCCKIASSIDGKLATKTGNSKWITSEKSRKMVQKLRKEYGCIITGINTILSDDPLLLPRKNLSMSPLDKDINSYPKDNIYLEDDTYQKFHRVILDSNLRIEIDLNIVKTSKLAKTIIFTDSKNKIKLKHKIKKLEEKNIDVLFVDTIKEDKIKEDNNKIKKLDIKKILEVLYNDYNITSILLESGPTLLTSFLKNNLIDKFIIFLAPKIIGGDSRYDMFLRLDIDKIENSVKINFHTEKKSGDDIVITAYPKNKQ